MAPTNSLPPEGFPQPDQPANSFTSNDVEPLAEELGLSDEQKILELQERLNRIAYWYEFNLLDDSSRLSVARSRLRKLRENASNLLKALDDLDSPTKEWLATSLRGMRGDARVRHLDPKLRGKERQLMGAVRNLVDLLHAAAHQAIETTPKGGGRPSLRPLSQACLGLAQVYEDLSGRKFTREKGRRVWTDSAHWVAKVAKMLSPTGVREPTDKELNTAMRNAVRFLKELPR